MRNKLHLINCRSVLPFKCDELSICPQISVNSCHWSAVQLKQCHCLRLVGSRSVPFSLVPDAPAGIAYNN